MKKRILGRRSEALGRIAVSLAIILLANLVFGVFYIFPIQAVRVEEQHAGLFHTQVIHREWAPARREGVYLTANRCGVQASVVTWNLGWHAAGAALDCSGGKLLYMGEFTFHDACRSASHEFFGRLGSWDIKRLEIRVTYTATKEGTRQNVGTCLLEVNEDDFIEWNDERYFLVRHFTPQGAERAIYGAEVTAYNARNEAILQQEVECILSTTRFCA